MELALGIVILVLSVVLTVLVLMQSGKGKELSGTIAGGNNSYFGNTKTTSKDKVLTIVTTVISIVFVVCVLALYLIAG